MTTTETQPSQALLPSVGEDGRRLLADQHQTTQRRKILAIATRIYGEPGVGAAMNRYFGRSQLSIAERWSRLTVTELESLEELLEEREAAMTEPSEHLLAVDGHNLLYRAFYALGARRATAAFLRQLDHAIAGVRATHVVVVFDSGGDGGRRGLWPAYKAQRPEAPPELRALVPLARATVGQAHPTVESGSAEADDVIAAYTREATSHALTVTIVSTDKDLQQLVGPSVGIWDTKQRLRIGEAEVTTRWGVAPSQIADVLALMGDSTDNVPGIRGIGLKGARELVQQHGDLESVLRAAAASDARSKRRELLVDQASAARLSRELVRLRDDLPLPLALDVLRRGSTIKHHCHARGCSAPTPPRWLMCPRHWRQVPKHLQSAVWNFYRPGQEIDKNPSHEWSRAADAAIAAVLQQETCARLTQLENGKAR